MDEVSRDAENPKVSQMIYPLMQALDIAHLGVDVAVGGIGPAKDSPCLRGRACLSLSTGRLYASIHPFSLVLTGKKCHRGKGNYISVDDTPEDIKKKMKGAFCVEAK